MASSNTDNGLLFPIIPDKDGRVVPCPDLLTEQEAIRFLRLDVDGPDRPEQTLQYYRERGLLRATRVGKRLRYRRTDLLALLDELAERTNARNP